MKTIRLYKLLPNFITLIGLCLGISAVRYAMDAKFTIAASLIIIAAMMDGIDGRLARFLKCSSDFGAQLDSLADVVSFGVAPAVVNYMWSLHHIEYHGVGWAIVLFYIACATLRLARFNVQAEDEEGEKSASFFVGVPITASAVLSITPMISSFQLYTWHINPWIVGLNMLCIGLLMISTIQTFSCKDLEIKRQYVPILLVLSSFLIAFIMFQPWIAIPFLALLYILSIPVSLILFRNNS